MANALKSITLRRLATATVLVLAAGYALAFFMPPRTPIRASSRRSSTCTSRSRPSPWCGFIVAAIHAIRHLRTGDPKHDARSYVSIHISVIFGLAVLLTGAIWAKGSWGVWWEWKEPTLVSFLIVFLLYATYYPLRYAIEDRDRQARYASVFAITAGAFVPLNFLAVRLAAAADPPAHLLLHRRPARCECCSPSSSASPGWRCSGRPWSGSSSIRSASAIRGDSLKRIRRRPGGDGVIPLLAIEDAEPLRGAGPTSSSCCCSDLRGDHGREAGPHPARARVPRRARRAHQARQPEHDVARSTSASARSRPCVRESDERPARPRCLRTTPPRWRCASSSLSPKDVRPEC